jgi:outer membrane receptor protein involved in Fe transport
MGLLVPVTLACSSAWAAAPTPAPAAGSSEAVVVTAQRLSVETLIDRKVYSIADDVQSTFGTVSDVLSAIPSVDVDPDGIVSLRGDTNVLVLIDGRPSAQLSGRTAGDALQTIPAQDIDHIEVMTTPPAEFKAEGAAGVINIVTRKKRPEGVAGSVQASLGSGGRSVVGANASYSTGGLTTALTSSYRQDFRQRSTRSGALASDPATSQLIDSTSSIDEMIRRAAPVVGLSADYAFSNRQSVSAAVSRTGRGGLRTYTELNDSSTPAGAITSSSRRMSAGHDPELDVDERLGFSRKLSDSGEKLDFTLHRSTSHQHEHYDYVNDSFVPPALTSDNNLSFHEDQVKTEFAADYVLPVGKTRSLKVGYAFNHDDYRFANMGNNVDPVTGTEIPDPNLTNSFSFLRRINAAYASYEASAGGIWHVLAGMRTEWTHEDARQVTNDLSNGRSYARIYPSLHVDRTLSAESTLSLGASRRVTYPDPDSLNPYVDHEYSPNLRAGNPNLQPQYTQSYEVGYGYEGGGRSYAVTGYYRRNRDSVTDVTEYLSSGFSLTTKTNLPRNDAAGLELSASGRVGARLTYGISSNLFYNQIDATALGAPGLQSTTGINAKVKLDYRPSPGDTVQVTATRTDKRLTPQGYVDAINIVNAGYKHRVKKDLMLVATVSDLFNGQRYHRYATTPTFVQDYVRVTRGRVLYMGLVYSFGSRKKDSDANFEYDQSLGAK